MLPILSAPHAMLSQKAEPIAKVDKAVLKLIGEMKQALEAAKDPIGVGLAAPQVGKLLRLFIVKPTPKFTIQVFINPKIVSSIKYHPSAEGLSKKNDSIPNTKYKISFGPELKTEGHNTRLEGCLSLPNIWGEVKREPELPISYLDERGKTHTRKIKGLISTIIQHEMDHLNGILFPKRVLEQKGKLYKSHKNEKGEDLFEEISL